MTDHAKIYLAAASSIGVSLSHVNTLLQILVGLSALGFSLWKWRRAVLKARKENQE